MRHKFPPQSGPIKERAPIKKKAFELRTLGRPNFKSTVDVPAVWQAFHDTDGLSPQMRAAGQIIPAAQQSAID